MNTEKKIIIGLTASAFIIMYGMYVLDKISSKNFISSGSVNDKKEDDIKNQNTLSNYDKNRIGQKVSIPSYNNESINGYLYPDDLSKLVFPLQVIVKPNEQLSDKNELSSFPIIKNNENKLVVKKYDGSYYETNFDELKQKTIIL